MRTHVLETTAAAYQFAELAIDDGDLLLVPSEGIAGWLEQSWPIAATVTVGDFHHLSAATLLLAEHPDRDHAHIERKVRAALAALKEARETALEDEAWDRNAALDRAA
ncbi:hypothetical protein [Nocardia carnea]|uniref:hypothetical protein n=1 Tax=Nocardia carnea TaxID=37328 RepID=UPI00245413D8|nr:hypothetical protein [Nocardia carnea]